MQSAVIVIIITDSGVGIKAGVRIVCPLPAVLLLLRFAVLHVHGFCDVWWCKSLLSGELQLRGR